MAESPLYKSLPIGSYGYWQQVPNVIDTKVYENLTFNYTTGVLDFNVITPTYEFELIKSEIRLELQSEIEFINDTEVKNLELK